MAFQIIRTRQSLRETMLRIGMGCLRFNDSMKTQIVFFVTRLRKCLSLREFAAETITDTLKDDKDSDIEDFEIPKTLKEELKVATRSQWTARWHKKWIRKQEELTACKLIAQKLKARKKKTSKRGGKKIKCNRGLFA